MTDTNIVATVQLSKQILTHKGSLSALEMREPTIKSYMKSGRDPFQFKSVNGAVSLEWDAPATVAFMSDVTGIDSALLESVTARDFLALRNALYDMIVKDSVDSKDPGAA